MSRWKQTKSVDVRDRAIAALQEQLSEIEERLIPTGLHVFGRPPESRKRADLLRMIASFDRPEHQVRSLPNLIAEGLGIEGFGPMTYDDPASDTRQMVESLVKEAIQVFCDQGIEAGSELLT